jgi:hypothetical protein
MTVTATYFIYEHPALVLRPSGLPEKVGVKQIYSHHE